MHVAEAALPFSGRADLNYGTSATALVENPQSITTIKLKFMIILEL